MRNQRLTGRKAVITGAGAGIGAATAFLMCQEGAAVLLVDRDADSLQTTSEQIRRELPDAQIASLVADVSDESAATHAVEMGIDLWGGVDTLINNAAMRNYSRAQDATPQEWQAMVAVNLVGMSNYCRAALPALRASGQGSIVNVSSCYAITGRQGMALYDATKAAQLAYTRTLAFEEAANGVRVNSVCPGSTLTEFHIQRAHTSGKDLTQLQTERRDTSLIGRWANPKEIAWPILWLSSNEASYITGTNLVVDGGLHIM